MPHNHEPLCCCGHSPASGRGRCPSCPEHGELAQLSKPHAIAYNPEDEDHDDTAARFDDQLARTELATRRERIDQLDAAIGRTIPPGVIRDAAECPSCHTPEGRPHTDYCPTLRDHTHRWGQVLKGTVNFPPVCVNCLARYDLPESRQPCPRYDAPITSTPPTTTTTPTNDQTR